MSTFQERSASFEHMYAPSRAKALFSKHTGLKDILDRDVKRMRWEWQTTDTELGKQIKIFNKRSTVLQRKVKDIEDRYFAALSEEDEEQLPRASTCPSLQRSVSNLGHVRRRPQTSHAPQAPQVQIKERPHSSVSRQSSNASRPDSGLLTQRKPQQTVRFARVMASAPVREDHGNLNRGTNSSQRQYRRQRAKSAFAITTAKKYELRNQRFYDENERYKGEIRDKIGDYLDRVDQYKEEYKRMLQRESQKPPVTEADVTELDDVSGDSKMENKFQMKLRNPFGMAAAFQNKRLEEEDKTDQQQPKPKQSNESQQQAQNNETDKKVAPLTVQNLSKLSLAKAESNPRERDPDQASTIRSHSTHKALRIRHRLAGISGEEATRERARLLYEEAHSDFKPLSATQRNIEEIKTPLIETKHTKLRADKRRLREAFDSFLDSDRTIEEMHKLVVDAAKTKAKTKKARDMSIVPFMAARRLGRSWKAKALGEHASHSQTEHIT